MADDLKAQIEKVLRMHATSSTGAVADALMEVVREAQGEAWDEGYEAGEADDCCGCNLRLDEDGEDVVNPYTEA